MEQRLVVVGIRIDPCFPASDPTVNLLLEPCHAQIRLIWQPLTTTENSEISTAISTIDAAVHTFYNLTTDEFSNLLQDLAKLKKSSQNFQQNLPLQVHPIIAKQGLEGSFYTQLRTIILSHAGEQQLSRFTFMTVEVPDRMWDFGGFDVLNGKVTRMRISRIGTPLQTFINSSPTPLSFRGGARPAATGEDTFNPIIERSVTLGTEDHDLLLASAQSMHRIENPLLHSPSTVDCVSCHAAEPARMWISLNFPNLGIENSAFKFQSPLNLDNVTATNFSPHRLRAFGYEKNIPTISQRTINESAAITEGLNGRSKLYFRRR